MVWKTLVADSLMQVFFLKPLAFLHHCTIIIKVTCKLPLAIFDTFSSDSYILFVDAAISRSFICISVTQM